MFYIITLILSTINLIMTIVLTFAEEESNVWKVYGYKENYIILGASIICFIIGFMMDRIKEHEEINERV